VSRLDLLPPPSPRLPAPLPQPQSAPLISNRSASQLESGNHLPTHPTIPTPLPPLYPYPSALPTTTPGCMHTYALLVLAGWLGKEGECACRAAWTVLPIHTSYPTHFTLPPHPPTNTDPIISLPAYTREGRGQNDRDNLHPSFLPSIRLVCASPSSVPCPPPPPPHYIPTIIPAAAPRQHTNLSHHPTPSPHPVHPVGPSARRVTTTGTVIIDKIVGRGVEGHRGGGGGLCVRGGVCGGQAGARVDPLPPTRALSLLPSIHTTLVMHP
jgi:hypothetical protein